MADNFETYKLPTQLDIRCVENIYNDFKNIISNEKSLEIDASEIEKITTPGIQLIISLANYLNSRNLELKFVNHSENLITNLKELGIDKTDFFKKIITE